MRSHQPAADGEAVPRASSAFRESLLVVAVVGVAVRLSYVMLVTQHERLLGDEPYFHLLPTWLSKGYGFRLPHTGIQWGALHPPLFSLLLTPVTFVASGNALLAQRLASASLGSITVVVVGLIGRELAGERAGVFAALLAALSPTLWVNDGLILSESLAALLVASVLLIAYRAADGPRSVTRCCSVLACGLAALTRGELILLLPFVGVPVLARLPRRSLRPRAIGCALIGTLVVIVPWSAYNTARFHRLVVVSTNLGMTLCGANNKLTYTGSRIGLWSTRACPSRGFALNEAAQNAFWTRTSIDYALHHVQELPIVALARLARILGLYAPGQMVDFERIVGSRPPLVSWAIVLLSPPIIVFAVYGIILLRRRHVFVAPLVGTIAMVMLIAITIGPDLRYRVPADVALVVLAAAALDHLAPSRGAKQSSRSGVENPAVANTAEWQP